MKSARELLDELNAADEHVRIEAKRSSEIGKSILQTVCAYANEPGLGGGYLLLGVVPVADSFWPMYEAEGVPNPDKIQSDLASQCASQFSTAIRPQICVEQVADKNVVVVFVPEANPHDKPIYFKHKPLPSSAWRRIGSADVQCTEDDLVVFYQGRGAQTFDEQTPVDARLSDIDPEVIQLYRSMRREVDRTAEELNWTDDEILESLKAVRQTDRGLVPTVAGVLLFGTPMALRRLFPMLRIDYIRVAGTRWVKDPDRRFDTVEIRSPLIRAINRARASVLDDIPKAFSLPPGETQSREIPALPDRVIREVIANAAMHRDYRVNGSIQLIRYSNRLEIRNPGYSLKAQDRLGEPGSDTRNPTIAAVLHDLKLAETKGSGIRVMREEMGARGLSPPLLESDRTGNTFLAILLFHHFLSDDDIRWLTSLDAEFPEAEMRAMVQAREVGAIDNSTYRELNRQADTLTASKQLRRLCDLGLLEKKGKGVKTYYQPTEKALANWPPGEVQSPEQGGVSPETEAESPEFGPKSPELEVKSPELEVKSPELGGTGGGGSSVSDLPPGLRERLASLGGKAPRGNMLDVTLELLKWRELSLSELASYLGREPDHIRKYYLKELLSADLVRPSHADRPNDPRQKYRAARKSSQ